MKRIRQTKDVNGQVTATSELNLVYLRIQPVTNSNSGREGDNQYMNQKIFFNPYIDVIPTDLINYEGKDYQIQSLYIARDKSDLPHHIEVVI